MSFSQTPGWVAPPQPSMGDTLNMLTSARNFQAQQAQANAYQQAIDPQTGAFDQNKFNAALVAQGTRGTWGGGAAMQQAGNATSALGVGTQEQVKAQLAQLGTLNGVLTPLMQQAGPGGQIPVERAQAALDQAHQAGLVNDTFYNQGKSILGRVPPGGNVYDLINGLQYANQSATTQLQSQIPTVAMTNIGGAIVPVGATPTMRGYGTQTGPGITTTISPDTGAQMVTVHKGTMTIDMPLRQFNEQGWSQQGWTATPKAGGGNVGPGNYPGQPGYGPGGGGGGGGPAPAPPAGGGGGGPAPAPAPQAPPAPQGGGGAVAGPGAPSNLPAPPQPPQQQPPPAMTEPWLQPPPPSISEQTPLGQTVPADQLATIQQENQRSTDASTALKATAQQTTNNIAQLDDAKLQLDRGAVVGPGTAPLNNIRNLLIAYGFAPEAPVTGVGAAAVSAATAQFNHDAALIQQAQLHGLGNPTDSRQELANLGSPSSQIGKLGNYGMIAMLKGNQLAIQAQQIGWQQAQGVLGWKPGQFLDWQQRFNMPDPTTGGRFDPRVFWMANMRPEDQAVYKGLIPPAERVQLGKNLRYAINHQWVQFDASGNLTNGSLTGGPPQ